jgi:hypothetical protein
MSTAKLTTDHLTIRRWAEARKGKPARVHSTGDTDATGLLRIDFPRSNDDETELEELTWEEFFEKFDDQRLAFVYQERTAGGARSRLNRFVSR